MAKVIPVMVNMITSHIFYGSCLLVLDNFMSFFILLDKDGDTTLDAGKSFRDLQTRYPLEDRTDKHSDI